MGSSVQINSITIDLSDHGFSLRGFVAEVRGRYPQNFWQSASFGDQQGDSIPPLSVPEFRWWSWLTRNINDSGLPSNSTSIISTTGLIGNQMTSPTAIDQERERNTDIPGNTVVVNENVNCVRSQNDDQRENAVVENENTNCERSQKDDQTVNAVVVSEDVNCQRSQQDDQTANAVGENEDVNCQRSQNDHERVNAAGENEDVNCERPQKDDQRATRSSKKVHPPPFKTYALRNKGKKVTVAPEPVGNKGKKVAVAAEPVGNKRAEKQNVEQLALAILASAVAEDKQPKESSESRSLFIGGVSCRKTRKVRTRMLKDLKDKPVINNTRREETSPQKKSKKRKSRPGSSSRRSRKVSTRGETSGSVLFNSVDSEHGGDSEPTDSGVDLDPIKGKKKNLRFQVDDELVQEENDADPCPPMAKRTMKLKKKNKKRRTRSKINPGKIASSSLQTTIEENETVPSPPRDERTEERVGNSLDDELASEGYFRKPNPQVNDRSENNGMSLREVGASYVPVFGNPSVPSTSSGLGTGPGAVYFGSSSNNNQRNTPLSTQVAGQSSVPHKDASVSDRKGKGVMVQSHDETENTQNVDLPYKEVGTSNNLPQEVPQKPKTPFLFDLNETYEEDVPSLEDNTNEAREEEDSIPIRSEQNSVELFPPRQNSSYMPSPSLMMPPPVQDTRRSSILFPGHNLQRLRNVPMTTPHPHHHPSPSPYQLIGVPPHQYRTHSPQVWASSSLRPPQYHHHHLSSPAPFDMDYSSMFAQQAPNNLSYYGASLMNQAVMGRMDPRFRSNTPVNHHMNNFFTPRHVAPVNQFNLPVNQFNPPVNQFSQLGELQRSNERPVFPRTISYQGRFQQRRNSASSSNASTSHAENSSVSSVCIVNRNPAEISDVEPGNVYMVSGEALRVFKRMFEFENAEENVGPVTESG